jgi:hypothetical protein
MTLLTLSKQQYAYITTSTIHYPVMQAAHYASCKPNTMQPLPNEMQFIVGMSFYCAQYSSSPSVGAREPMQNAAHSFCRSGRTQIPPHAQAAR